MPANEVELLALFGPTGVGKTQIAIELAECLPGSGAGPPVAVSADAIQVYEGLDVLSGKATAEQQQRLEHRLISYVPLSEEYSVGEYAVAAHEQIDELIASQRLPIVVGGTGLYLRAALTELDLRPPAEPELRAEIEAQLATLGSESLHTQLSPATAATVHPNDGKRIVRALELEAMGKAPHTSSDELWSDRLRRPTALFGIVVDRDELAQRVSQRVEQMLERGAIGEVESAIDLGISRTARKALGFKEIAAFATGDVERSQLAEEVTRRHLAYAKRQMTWMRKLSGVELIDRSGLEDSEVAERLASAVS